MQEWLIHDSQLPRFRSPFGAVSCHTAITLSLAVAESRQPASVILRLWRHNHGEEMISMAPGECQEGYCFYHTVLTASAEPGWLWYYFIVESHGQVWYYGNNAELWGGVGQIVTAAPLSWQITVHEKGLATPAWFKEVIMYQIFVDRFYNGNENGTVENAPPGSLIHAHWNNSPVYVRDIQNGHILAYDFFGGNLSGVLAKLPYLKELGVGVIYFNPIFAAASNHKYDTGDYKTIDPMFGSNELFSKLASTAQELGIAIILDGVFSHTGSDSIYFNREGRYPSVGAYQSPDSPYSSWYRFQDWPNQYECWWGVDTLPNVEEFDPSYQEFMIGGSNSVVRHWAALGAKGWRLDVADELPDEFIEKFRCTLKQLDGEAVLIGEVWEDASRKESYGVLRPYLQGRQLDSVMNYPFRRLVLDFLWGKKSSAETNRALMSLKENYPAQHFYACMNLLGSHDVPRILTLLGDEEDTAGLSAGQLAARQLSQEQKRKAVARLKAASLWQLTFPGVPCIYYGDEAGVEGYTDPLNRRTYPWGREDMELLDWYKRLAFLRNNYAVLRTGDWQPLAVSDDVLAYVRQITGGYDVFGQQREDNLAVVLINRREQTVHATVDLNSRLCGIMLHDMMNGEAEAAVGGGILSITLPPYGTKLLMERVHTQNRTCGVLLHPTSLPSPYGIGDLGSEACRFIDFLAEAGQKLWQILPLNPPGTGESPYMALSAFAGNPLLISPEKLVADGLLTRDFVDQLAGRLGVLDGDSRQVDFDQVKLFKESLWRQAFAVFRECPPPLGYEAFVQENTYWLNDYTLFMAATNHYGGLPWNQWEKKLAEREAAAISAWRCQLSDEIAFQTFLQYLFFRQWQELKDYAHTRGISIIGDLPIFVAHNSSDVWANRPLFALDHCGNPAQVAGVPPDYFSKNGQLWGNPLYDWEAMAADEYRWWHERFACLLKQVDLIRVDHFRGFEAYWEIEAGEQTAINGRWVKGPGERFFRVMEKKLGPLPIIAEDLGCITAEVVKLRSDLGFPGMKVLHFCFSEPRDGNCPPLGLEYDSVVYTGTHDNNTTTGWYLEDLGSDPVKECVDAYLGMDGHVSASEICWRLIELAYQSKACTVIVPLQDILTLDGAARMNHPGTVGGANWAWRCRPGYAGTHTAERLRGLVARYGR